MINHPGLPETEKIFPDLGYSVLKVGQSQENWDSIRQPRMVGHSTVH